MVDQVLLYISAAMDLERERELLGRCVVDVPVTLGWRILLSPGKGESVDTEAIEKADLHLVLLGGDIRAPVGFEWYTARNSHRRPALFVKQGIQRTPAAQSFLRYLKDKATWVSFKESAELREKVLKRITEHIYNRAGYYALSPTELVRLTSFRKELEAFGLQEDEDIPGATGESSVILSPERYIPSEGILLESGKQNKPTELTINCLG